MFHGLCDCNHFYASCERLYRPDLRDRPVIVLSNNDGCVVALTGEAKEAGIRRGDAYFKIRDIVEKKRVSVFSSNYALYQDISDKVMDCLRDLVDGVQQYSIDESFFTVQRGSQAWCEKLRSTMVQWTGMPMAVSLARTKTLAKAAEEACKHTRNPALFVAPEMEEELLRNTGIRDVWGIGGRNGPRLVASGVLTAYDLTLRDDFWIRRHLGITGLKTVMELRGINAISVAEPERKSMCSGISFGQVIEEKEALKEAAARHAMTLAFKLHERHLMASRLTFNAFTDRFREDFISPVGQCVLRHETSYAPLFIAATGRIIDHIWRPGRYKGCRLWATELVREGSRQLEFSQTKEAVTRFEKEDRLGSVVEDIHRRYGRLSITVGATGLKGRDELMRREMLSPHYTTRFSDLPEVNSNPIGGVFSKKYGQ